MQKLRQLVGLLAMGVVLGVASPAAAWFEVPESARAEGALHDGDERVETWLLVDAEQVAPGDTVRVAVAVSMDQGWHIYWKNPGDAGVPTDIRWRSDQMSFGPLKWSAPELFSESGGELTVFGYADRVLLFSEAKVSEEASGGVTVSAKIDYLACSNACMPGHSRLTRTIPVGGTTERTDSKVLAALDKYSGRVPQRARDYGLETEITYGRKPLAPGEEFEAALEVVACGEATESCADWRPIWSDRTHAFITDEVSRADVEVADVRQHPDAELGWVYHLEGTVREETSGTKELLSGVVRFRDAGGTAIPIFVREALPFSRRSDGATEVDSPMLSLQTPSVKSAAGSEAASGSGAGGGGSPISLGWALLMAFVGGVILNLMPCVFPVLALKVTSFTRVVRESRTGILAHGAAYTGGVVGSMLALASVVIGLRAAGTQVGWGFQFQQPAFPAILSGVVVLFALSLFDVYDVNVQATDLSQSTQQKSGVRRSIGEGILAVVLATPCSAPFLGTAVGFAFTGSALTIIAVFATLGLGLAAPFVALTLVPGWAKLLPDPGDWMKYLKEFLGFALFATAAWLLWLVGRQAGVDAMARVLGLLLVVALGAWVFGAVQYSGSALRKWGLTAATVVSIVGAGSFVFPIEPAAEEATREAEAGGEIDWKEWSREAVREQLEQGRAVFVDFTADWCLTCKVNERNAINAASVVETAREENVVMLKADWTNGGEEIRRELQRHGKAGVPMYLVYSPDAPDEPVVLPEVLSADRLVGAFERAAKGNDE